MWKRRVVVNCSSGVFGGFVGFAVRSVGIGGSFAVKCIYIYLNNFLNSHSFLEEAKGRWMGWLWKSFAPSSGNLLLATS